MVEEITAPESPFDDFQHLRIADYSSVAPSATTESTLSVVNTLSPSLSDMNGPISSSRADLHHVVATIVLCGWQNVKEYIKSDRDWRTVSRLDERASKCGHGKIARLAWSYLFRLMDEYLKSQAQQMTNFHTTLPSWYVPSENLIASRSDWLTVLMPWPAFRHRMGRNLDKYYNDAFLDTFAVHGARFIWPYQVQDAAYVDTKSGNYTFTAEFLLRVSSLRSFALARDFLELYPEFRGDAPQLEPSPTLYKLREKAYMEALYWQKLRNRTREETTNLEGVPDSTHPVGDPSVAQQYACGSPPSTMDETEDDGTHKKPRDRLRIQNLID